MNSQNMSEATPPPRKRRRPALSCAECRRRKIKCDRNVPCSQCTLSKSPTCTYSGDSPRNIAGHFPAPIRSLTPSSGRNIPSAVSINGISAGNSPDTISLVTGSQFNVLNSPGVESHSFEQEDLVDRVKKLEQLLAQSVARKEKEIAIPSPSLPKASDTLRGTVSKTRYYGQSHWMYAFEQFEKIAWFKDVTYNGEGRSNNVNCFNAGKTVSDVRTLLNNCKNLARTVKADIPTPILLPQNLKDHVPQREVSDKLIDLYFRTQESTYRILHIPSFQREYELYWNDPQAASTGFIVKLLLVMAVGTCFYQGNNSNYLRSQAVRWVYVAQNWMLSPFEKGRLNFSGLQVHCLRLLARQTTGVAGDLLWISAGALLRQGIQMGYHRDPKYLPPMTVFHSELRRRLWATIMEMNVQFSLDSGMQPHFSIDDFDTLPPANLNDSDIDENTKILPVSKPKTVFTNTSIQIALLKSLSTRLESIKLINGFRSEPSYDEVLRLGTQLTTVCKETSRFLHQSNSSASQTEHKPTALESIILDISIRRFILALHRPFAIKARSDPRFYFSRKLSLDTAMNMLSHLSSAPSPASNSTLPRSPISHASPNNALLQGQDELTRLKLCGGTFFKEVMIHAAVIILFELVVQLEEAQAESSSYPLQTRASREPLRQALRDIVELCAERIRLGENNVKGHLFISIALGQTEAMEEGANVEQGIVEAARVSAGICSGLLRERIGARNVNVATPGDDEGLGDGNWEGVEGGGMEQGFGFDFMMQDPSFDFDIPESWVVSEWDENAVW